jgi:hypothetical protein
LKMLVAIHFENYNYRILQAYMYTYTDNLVYIYKHINIYTVHTYIHA